MVAAYCFALEFFNRKQHDTWVEKAYRHAIELDETDAYMWANLARLQAFRGNRSEATDNYRKTLACMSGNEDALYAIELRMRPISGWKIEIWRPRRSTPWRNLRAPGMLRLLPSAPTKPGMSCHRARTETCGTHGQQPMGSVPAAVLSGSASGNGWHFTSGGST